MVHFARPFIIAVGVLFFAEMSYGQNKNEKWCVFNGVVQTVPGAVFNSDHAAVKVSCDGGAKQILLKSTDKIYRIEIETIPLKQNEKPVTATLTLKDVTARDITNYTVEHAPVSKEKDKILVFREKLKKALARNKPPIKETVKITSLSLDPATVGDEQYDACQGQLKKLPSAKTFFSTNSDQKVTVDLFFKILKDYEENAKSNSDYRSKMNLEFLSQAVSICEKTLDPKEEKLKELNLFKKKFLKPMTKPSGRKPRQAGS